MRTERVEIDLGAEFEGEAEQGGHWVSLRWDGMGFDGI